MRSGIALARAWPGELNYSTSSPGSGNHLAAELFRVKADVNLVRINYKGTGSALNSLASGEVQLSFPSAGSVMPHLRAGRVRALAVTSAQPSALAPDLPKVPRASGEQLVQVFMALLLNAMDATPDQRGTVAIRTRPGTAGEGGVVAEVVDTQKQNGVIFHILAPNSAPVSGQRPAATVLFRSMARQSGASGIGVLLTETPEGITISKVEDGTPASAAGIQPGDIIIKVNDTTVNTGDQLSKVLRSQPPGTEVRITVLRDGTTRVFGLTLATRPSA